MKNYFLSLVLLCTTIFAQTARVTTLSGTTTPASYYITNSGYNNGAGNLATYVSPTGVAVSSSTGIVYTFDQNANVIRKVLPNGFTSEFCGNSTFTSPSFAYGYQDGTGSNALFSDITAIAIDNNDILYVLDNNRLRKINPSGTVSTIVSNQTSFRNGQGLCTDGSGNIYVSDTDNDRIRKVTSSGLVTTIASGFSSPKGITIHPFGDLYVTDVTAVKKVTMVGTVSIYATGFADAYGICFKGATFYVSDTFEHQIKQINSGVVSPYAGNGRPRFRDGDATFTTFGASFYSPKGLAVDSSGNVIVADTNNQRIRKITP